MNVSKIFIAALIPIIVTGCSLSPSSAISYQNENGFSDRKFKSAGGENLSVNDLKKRYKEETGNDLPSPPVEQCGRNDLCYYNLYASEYDKLINTYRYKLEKERKVAEDAACQKDYACSKNKKISIIKSNLRQQYGFMLSMNPYNQGDVDLIFRTVCSSAVKSYKKGSSKAEFINKLKDAPGLGPQLRGQLSESASLCWDSASEGLDWNEIIRQ